MLTKELKPHAERIAQELRPLFVTAYKLGKKYDITRDEQHKAERIAHSWTHPNAALDWQYKGDGEITQQEREEVRRVYNENKRDWDEICAQKWQDLHRAEVIHRCARINFINYLNYMAHYLGDLIRPIWRAFIDKRGLETLAELINQENPRPDRTAGACSCSIYYERADLDARNPQRAGQCAWIQVSIYTGWACGISGRFSRWYQINPAEEWTPAELPHIITPKEYQKNAAKIAAMVRDIENRRDILQNFAQECGLLGFVEIVSDIKKTL